MHLFIIAVAHIEGGIAVFVANRSEGVNGGQSDRIKQIGDYVSHSGNFIMIMMVIMH